MNTVFPTMISPLSNNGGAGPGSAASPVYEALAGETGVVSKLFEWGDLRRYGADPSGVADCSAAIAGAITARKIILNGGTYRVSQDVTVPFATVIDNTRDGSVLKVSSGKQLWVNGIVQDTKSQIWDVSEGGVVTGFFRNDKLRPEWWGAIGVAHEGIDSDAHGAANGVALNQAVQALYNNKLSLSACYGVDRDVLLARAGDHDISFPDPAVIPYKLSAGWTIEGEGSGTMCGLMGVTTAPNGLKLFNFTDVVGPQRYVLNVQATGRRDGNTSDIGFYAVGANGVWWDHCWARGVAIGFNLAGSNIGGDHNVCEFCTVGFQFDPFGDSGISANFDDSQFYRCGTDVLFPAGDYEGCSMGRTTHVETTGICVKIDGGTNIRFEEIIHAHSKTDGAQEVNFKSTTLHLTGGANHCDFGFIAALEGGTGVFFENAQYCTVQRLNAGTADHDGPDIGVLWANAVTTNCRVLSADVRRCVTAGVQNLDSGVGNYLGNFSITGCPVGAQLADLNNGIFEMENGVIEGNTTPVLVVSPFNAMRDRNVRLDVTTGDWFDNAKISYHFTVGAMGTLDVWLKGSPEGVVAAPVGSIARSVDASGTSSVYHKELGTGNTGWVRSELQGPSGTAINGEVTTAGVPTATTTAVYTWRNTSRPSMLIHITGYDAAGNWFADLLFAADAGSSTFTVLSSQSGGTPGARTYSIAGPSLYMNVSVAQVQVRARAAELSAS